MKVKRLLSVLLATLLVALLAFSSVSARAAEEDDPAYEHALALKDAGILFGYPGGSFGLDRQFKRSESVAVLLRALGVYEEAGKTPYEPVFTDVPEDHWAAPYILYAYENEMTRGVSETAFAPDRYVTAKEFCTLLLRYLLESPEIEPDTVYGWIVTQTPLDKDYMAALFERDTFLRSDMVEIVYTLCVKPPDYGKPVTRAHANLVYVDDIFYLEVQADAFSPFTWAAVISDQDIVTDIGLIELDPEPDPDGGTPIDSNPYTCIYQFKALAKGTATITMTWTPPEDWPKDGPVVPGPNLLSEVREFTIIVAEPDTPIAALDLNAETSVPLGGLARISLESNASTGYTWVMEDNEYLELVLEEYVMESSALPGAPGQQNFTFHAVKKGSTEITLHYVRPWETGVDPIQTVKVKVIVE